jgi:hypothetical protein
MYPRGQPSLLDDPMTAYVNDLRTTGAAPGSTTTQRARTARRHDPTGECNVCVATASSSSKSEPAPRHRGADDQWCVRLDELAEARCQLDEELALQHQELGVEAGPRERQLAQGAPVQGQAHDGNGDRRPTQDVPVQGEPRVGNGDRRERQPAADQPRGRAPTPPARTGAQQQSTRQRRRERQSRRRRTATLPAGVPESCHCGHAAARLLGACKLRGATSAPAIEGAARGCGSAASGKLHLATALGARAGWSAICPRPKSTSFPATGTRGRSQSRGISGPESTRAQP